MRSGTARVLVGGSVWRSMGTLMVAVAVVAITVGCEPEEQSTETEELPGSITFEVDGDGVYYRWREPDGTMATAQSLSEIPLAARPVVAVFSSEKMDERAASDGYYVANLLDAESGDELEARRREAVWLNRAGDATDRAARIALKIKETVTPEASDDDQGDGQPGDHEKRKWEVDLGKIDGEPNKAKLFDDEEAVESPEEAREKIEKVVGSESAPVNDRRTDGTPAAEQPEEASEEAAGETDDSRQPTLSDGDDEGDDARPSRRELRQKMEKMQEEGALPESMER